MAESSNTKTNWYQLTPEQVAKELGVDPAKGLSAAEAQQRQQKYGPNEMAAKREKPAREAFLRQYRDFMQIILLVAAAAKPYLYPGPGDDDCAARVDGI